MKGWKGKLLLVLTGPLIVLGLAELILRVMGAGYDPSCLIEATVDGEAVWVENPFFTYHLFDPPLARIPVPIVVKKNKPEKAFRIVVLGESAAQGDPLPDYGPPRLLEYTMRGMDPQADIQVINAAITAINSHAIKAMSRELWKLQPDVVIVYMGNNEVIGPFGPGTVFSGFMQSDSAIDLVMFLNRFRLAQLLRFAIHLTAEAKGPVDFRGVAMFMDKPVTYDDPRLETVRRRYEKNMRRIIRNAQDAGAEVLLSTVAVNKTDCPPSLSVRRKNLSRSDDESWHARFDRGESLLKMNAWSNALENFRVALELDDTDAGLHYAIGICLEKLGETVLADHHFSRACDLDAFRYRADSQINQIIRKVAASGSVHLIDVAREFKLHPVWRDADLFVDHVHFTFEGASLLASLWADTVATFNTSDNFSRNAPGPDATALREKLLYTYVAEISVLQEMLRRYGRPPFNRQFDSRTRMNRYQDKIREMDAKLRLLASGKIMGEFAERIAIYPDDYYFPQHYAQHLIALNRFIEAKTLVESSVLRHPHRRGPRTTMAFLLAREGRADEAANILLGYQKKHGYFVQMGANYLVTLLHSGGLYQEARDVLQAMDRHTRRWDYRWRLRVALSSVEFIHERMQEADQALLAGKWMFAEQLLSSVLKKRPDTGEAIFLSGFALAMQGNQNRGFQIASHGLATMNYARANYHGGVWQATLGNPEQAAELFDAALEKAGDDAAIIKSIVLIRSMDKRKELGDPEPAIALLENLISRMERPSAELLETMSIASASHGETENAYWWLSRALDRAKVDENPAYYSQLLERKEDYDNGRPLAIRSANRPFHYYNSASNP